MKLLIFLAGLNFTTAFEQLKRECTPLLMAKNNRQLVDQKEAYRKTARFERSAAAQVFDIPAYKSHGRAEIYSSFLLKIGYL